MLHPFGPCRVSPGLQSKGCGCRGNGRVHDWGFIDGTEVCYTTSISQRKLEPTVGIVADGGLLAAAWRLTTRAWLRCLLGSRRKEWNDIRKDKGEEAKMTAYESQNLQVNSWLNEKKNYMLVDVRAKWEWPTTQVDTQGEVMDGGGCRCGVIRAVSHEPLFQMPTIQILFLIFNSMSRTLFLGKFLNHSLQQNLYVYNGINS